MLEVIVALTVPQDTNQVKSMDFYLSGAYNPSPEILANRHTISAVHKFVIVLKQDLILCVHTVFYKAKIAFAPRYNMRRFAEF